MIELTACKVDLERGQVFREDQVLSLTTREVELLRFLVARAGQVVSREELLREVWGYSDAVVSRASDNAVRRLREKIERDPTVPDHVLTSFGSGYRFVRTGQEPEIVEPAPHRVVQIGQVTVDLTARRARRGEEPLELSEAEARALEALLAAGGELIGRHELARAVWGRSSGGTRKLDGLVSSLRAKLEPDPQEPQYLLTARGHGHRLQLDAPEVPPLAEPVQAQLPAERERFVGRAAELARLEGAMDEGARLVTLLGPGGVGKTRLAIRYAWSALQRWPAGAWFCDLSDVRSVSELALAVGRTLDLVLGTDALGSVGRALARRGRCLVVLDNFEQLVAHAEPTVGRWLELAPEAHFVVTSRELLAIPGELALSVEPLEPPDAVALFELRARWARREFVLAEQDRPTVETLVAMLDHLPLTIELAASRVRSMSPASILERLEQRFRLLVSASPAGRPARHATMRATLDWSWDLLAEIERSALAQLSMLEGPFSIELAEQLLDVGDAWPADVVQALIERSLVQRGDELSLLWTVRDYALERLDELGLRASTELRHAQIFAEVSRGEHEQALRSLPDVIAACRRAVARGDVEIAAVTGYAAIDTLTNKGPFSLAEELARSVLELSALSPMWRARLLHQLGEVIRHQGRAAEAGRYLEDALAFARLAGDRTEEAATLDTLGNLESDVGRLDTAFAFYHDALAIHRANGAVRREATVLANLGLLHYRQGRLSEAHELISQSIAGHRSVNYLDGVGSSLSYLAMVLLRQGLPQQARQAFEESLVHHRQTAYAQGEVMVLINLGGLELDAGRQEEGRRYLREAAALAEKIGSRSQLGAALHNLGTSYKPEKEAEGYLRAALAIQRDIGNVEDEGVALLGLAGYYMDRDELTAAGEHFGAALALFRKISLFSWEGDALLGLAWVSTRQGAPDEARAWLDLAQQHLAEKPSGRAGVEYVTGELLAREGRWDEARAHFTSVVATFQGLQDQVTVARALKNWARLEEEAGHTAQAAVLRSEIPETT